MSRRKSAAPSEKEDVPAPIMVEDYNAHMGFVDTHGMRIRSYMTHRTSKSWWRCVFYWLLDCACFNAYLVYAHQPFDRHHQKVEFRPWLLRLADELIAGKSFRSRLKKRKTVVASESAPARVAHSPVFGQRQMRCSVKHCPDWSTMTCFTCKVYLCKKHIVEQRYHPDI